MSKNFSKSNSPVLPGQTLGILGGGQLGRMFAISAARMGYRVTTLDPTPDCPASQVCHGQSVAAYDDIDAAVRWAESVAAVTFEFENVPPATVAAIAKVRPVHPSAFVLETCCHRIREKTFLRKHGFPTAQWRRVESEAELATALGELGTPSILKTADFGYDGKGQQAIKSAGACGSAWAGLGRPVGILEAFVPFEREISVVCARGQDGEMRCFDPVENVHSHHILDVTLAPATLRPQTARAAVELAQSVAEQIGVVGMLAVEMFLVGEDTLLVNELAPRPHNSGHFSFDACVTSQFEQQVRATCGLPLGDPQILRPAAMANLLGDLWADGEPDWAAVAAMPEVKLHLYGKAEARPGRKMGHLTAMADTPQQAADRLRQARAALTRGK